MNKEKVSPEVVKEMMGWYDEGKNQKAQEIALYVERLAEDASSLGYPRAELFTQGVLFGYFLKTKEYIT